MIRNLKLVHSFPTEFNFTFFNSRTSLAWVVIIYDECISVSYTQHFVKLLFRVLNDRTNKVKTFTQVPSAHVI